MCCSVQLPASLSSREIACDQFSYAWSVRRTIAAVGTTIVASADRSTPMRDYFFSNELDSKGERIDNDSRIIGLNYLP